MVKIIKMKKMPKGKYKITFDNADSLVLYEEVIVSNVILNGKEVSEKLYQKLIDDNHKANPYHQALHYISIRKRSEGEVYKYLKAKGLEEYLIEQTIDKLKKEGYIDDLSFAKSYINDKLGLSKDGLMKIKKALIDYKVDNNIIDNLLSDINQQDISDRIDTIIEKQIRLNTKYSGNILKNRILNYLINLGYDGSTVIERLGMYDLDSSGDIQKEYQKAYKKYSNKYSDYKLEMKIKEYLYQKGYKYSEIDAAIE